MAVPQMGLSRSHQLAHAGPPCRLAPQPPWGPLLSTLGLAQRVEFAIFAYAPLGPVGSARSFEAFIFQF